MRRNCRGQALLIVIALLAIIITFTGVLLRFEVEANRLSARRLLACQSLSLAESGLEIAVARLSEDPSYRSETLSLERGKIEIVLAPEETSGRKMNLSVSADYGYPDGIRMEGTLEATLRLEDDGSVTVLWRRVREPARATAPVNLSQPSERETQHES